MKTFLKVLLMILVPPYGAWMMIKGVIAFQRWVRAFGLLFAVLSVPGISMAQLNLDGVWIKVSEGFKPIPTDPFNIESARVLVRLQIHGTKVTEIVSARQVFHEMIAQEIPNLDFNLFEKMTEVTYSIRTDSSTLPKQLDKLSFRDPWGMYPTGHYDRIRLLRGLFQIEGHLMTIETSTDDQYSPFGTARPVRYADPHQDAPIPDSVLGRLFANVRVNGCTVERERYIRMPRVWNIDDRLINQSVVSTLHNASDESRKVNVRIELLKGLSLAGGVEGRSVTIKPWSTRDVSWPIRQHGKYAQYRIKITRD